MMNGSKFTQSQHDFVYSQEQFPALVAGYGAGKTAAAIARIIRLKRLCPAQDVAYYLPTYPLVQDIAFQRFPALFEKNGIDYKLNQQKAEIDTGIGRILFRNMEQPHRIVGYEVAHSICDELDTLPTDKARSVWNRVIARNRQKAYTVNGTQVPNTVAVATTPEGFRFVYEQWKKQQLPGYKIYRASTHENAHNLPKDYIQNLKNTYPENLLAAYLNGEFVNMTAGSVYPDFCREKNGCFEIEKEKEDLHVGMDFNVGQGAAVLFVIRDGNPIAVNELTGVLDTPSMCVYLRRYKDKGHRIFIYPDASGGARKSNNASETDLSLLRQAGFTVLSNSRNPSIRDRILTVNKIILDGEERRLRVNIDRCSGLVESLEKQAYNKHGEPDKQTGLDHCADAAGYFITYKFPVVKQRGEKLTLLGL